MLGLVRRDANGAIFDVAMGLRPVDGVDPQRVGLIAARQRGDLARNCRREQERAALLRRGVENELDVFAKAQIEHLVGLVQRHRAQRRQVEASTFDVVAQASRRAHDDVAAVFERARLAAHVHAADASCDARAGGGVEPDQFALDLHGEFARGRDHKRQRRAGRPEPLFAGQQRGGERKPVGDGLARAGLGRDEQIAPVGLFLKHGLLHRGEVRVALGDKSALEKRMNRWKRHEAERPLCNWREGGGICKGARAAFCTFGASLSRAGWRRSGGIATGASGRWPAWRARRRPAGPHRCGRRTPEPARPIGAQGRARPWTHRRQTRGPPLWR